jgi:hypothetical protein
MDDLVRVHPPQAVPEDGIFVLPIPEHYNQRWARKQTPKNLCHLEEWGPKYFVFRSAKNAIGAAKIQTVSALMQLALEGDGYSHTGIKAFIPNDKSRSPYDAKHIGLMNHYGGDMPGASGLRVTRDTATQSTEEQTNAIKRLLVAIHEDIAPVICDSLRSIDPLVFQFQQRYVGFSS